MIFNFIFEYKREQLKSLACLMKGEYAFLIKGVTEIDEILKYFIGGSCWEHKNW